MTKNRLETPLFASSRTIEPPGNVAALRDAVGRAGGVMLESVAGGGPGGRFSYYAMAPRRTYAAASETHKPLEELADIWRSCRNETIEAEVPFTGGWIGHISYEAGRYTEPSAGWDRRMSPLPIAQWSLFDTVLAHDAENDVWRVAGVQWDDESGQRTPLAERLDQLAAFAASAGATRNERCPPRPTPAEVVWDYSQEAYLRKIERVLDYIRAGDIFQVNITRRCRAATRASAIEVYESLCEANPASFAAFLPTGDGAILSSSPELFLRLDGRSVASWPIKGTRPRGATPALDEAAACELAASQKDRAELNMIVDLVRNDLGRVCEYGTIQVASEGAIETHPSVLHRTARITGELREGLDAMDLIRATFPGGSITGAPKVRAMQIIHELEPTARGAYCGAIGYVGLNGDAQLNLPIRTMTMANGGVDVQVGSGIVADSDPYAEYEELEAKAAGMFAAIGVASAYDTFSPAGRRRLKLAESGDRPQ